MVFVAETPTFAPLEPVPPKRRGHGMGDGLLNREGRHDGAALRPPLRGRGVPVFELRCRISKSGRYACVSRRVTGGVGGDLER